MCICHVFSEHFPLNYSVELLQTCAKRQTFQTAIGTHATVLHPTLRPNKLIGSGRLPQVALVGAVGGGGSRPLDPPPSPTPDKVFNTQYTFSSEQMISADEHMRILLSQWRTPMVPSQGTAGLRAKQALWVSAADA